VSYKTDRLIELFPDAYGADDRESLLYKLLDSVGWQLMLADESVKLVLKSHWVDYASGPALDALGAIYGIERRTLINEQPESDEAFRQRLKSVVQVFTGGGTRQAVLGAVRSAVGLPFNLDQLNLPPQHDALRKDIEKLIELIEFSPTTERTLFDISERADDATQLILSIQNRSTQDENPRIEWTFNQGAGRRLSLELVGSSPPAGIRSVNDLLIPVGATLVLTVNASGQLSAVLNEAEIGDLFTNLDGTPNPSLPRVPVGVSEWKFRASGGLFNISTFDEGDSFDLPAYRVEMSWTRYQPLTFEVRIPYFLKQAVDALAARRGYTGQLFVYLGLPPERIQDVVNQTKAAGVRGSVQFALYLYENHVMREQYRMQGVYQFAENAGARDAVVTGSVTRLSEAHQISDSLVIGAVFDVSPFDGSHGYAE
jgi:hypothetical protein